MDEGLLSWRNLAGSLVFIAILGLAGSYLGWLHPLGDSLAVVRPLAIMAVLLTAVLASMAGMQLASFGATLLALICGLQIFLAYTVPGPPGRVMVYQKNVLFLNDRLADLAEDIRAAKPVVITLQEITEPNLWLLEDLRESYPTQQVCPGNRVGGPAVASSLPMVDGTGFCAPGLAAMQVRDGERQFWVVSVHLHWPWPYQQAKHIDALLPILSRLEGPVIMGGDFNMVVWAHGVKSLAGMTRTTAAGPTLGTYTGFEPWPRLPIDHVFAPSGGRTSLRGAFGSDHLGVLALVEL